MAVLPFTTRSRNEDDLFFSDGVHDDLLTQLAKISGLRVISRTSVEDYRGTTKRIPEIAGELGVQSIVEGAVQRSGDMVRITAQLDHPNIVPVYNLEETRDGTPAYSMKVIRGRTFTEYISDCRDQVLDGEKLDEKHRLSTRLEHFLKVCDAIAYAHDRG